MLYGIVGVQKDVALAAKRVLMTVKEIVDVLLSCYMIVCCLHEQSMLSVKCPAALFYPMRMATMSGTTPFILLVIAFRGQETSLLSE